MISIIYFLLGILFITFFPLIEELIGLISTIIESAKGYFTLKITDYNIKIQKLSIPESSVHAIGFSYQSEEQEYEYEDD